MPCIIKNHANIDLSDLEPHVQGVYDYFDQKIGFQKPPTMNFESEPNNEDNVLGKTAYYDPMTIQIHIYTDGRHPKDMLRSIAHELIHHWQNEEGRLDVGGYSGPGYYLKNKRLKNLEDEAMRLGNGYLREYEDNLKLKENKKMSLKEWKNNELSGLLMKRFGILEEDADKNTGMTDVAGDDEDDTYMGHEKKDDLKEDSGEEEKRRYEDNAWNDKDHIEAIEKHLRALKKGKDYDEGHEDLEETVSGRKDPRNRKSDENTNLRPMEEAEGMEDEDDLLTDKEAKESSKEDSIGVANESLKESIRRVLKKNKKLRLRFK